MIQAINILAYRAGGRLDVAAATGSSDTAMFVYDIAPGASSCPYHYEYVEEWMLVVAGEVAVRTPDGERTLHQGDIVCFPPGPSGAHKVMNRSSSPARTLLFSAARSPAVSVYPDSDKLGVWPGGPDDLIFVRSSAVPWSHGEEGWDQADPEPRP